MTQKFIKFYVYRPALLKVCFFKVWKEFGQNRDYYILYINY